jgi:hypothetical protein
MSRDYPFNSQAFVSVIQGFPCLELGYQEGHIYEWNITWRLWTHRKGSWITLDISMMSQ